MLGSKLGSSVHIPDERSSAPGPPPFAWPSMVAVLALPLLRRCGGEAGLRYQSELIGLKIPGLDVH